MIRRYLCLLALGLLVLSGAAGAAVRSVEIAGRTLVLDGTYERIVGRVHFGMNPTFAASRIVRDLDLAQLNAAGEAECAADFDILQPTDAERGNGTVLFEVSNRGGKGMLNRFTFARGAGDFGDEWVMKQGFTLVWLGWGREKTSSNSSALHVNPPHHPPGAPTDWVMLDQITP